MQLSKTHGDTGKPDTRVRFRENAVLYTVKTLGNCPDRSGQPKVLDAAGGARTTTASAQVGQPRAGTPCPRGLSLPTERAHVTSPSARSRLSYPAGGSSRGPARPRARPAGRPAARSRRPACFLLRRAARRLGIPDWGEEAEGGGPGWGRLGSREL